MAFVLAPFCRETTNGSSGTAVLSLGGVPDGSYETFVGGVGNGNTTDYAIREAGVGWIVCRGTVADATPDTLTRTSILASSNGGSDVTFGSSVQVYGVVSHTTLNALAALESVSNLRIPSNISGSTGPLSLNTLTAILDAILGSTRGEIPYRGASVWSGLSPGKAGYTLQLSSNLDPTWVNVASGGKGGTTGTVASTWQQACNRATTAALPSCTYSNGSSGVGATLTATANGALTIDGATVSAANRILVKDQASAAQNGIYTVTTVGTGANGTWTRATDADTSAKVMSGMTAWVDEGTTFADTAWTLITDGAIVLGTTTLSFTQTSGLGQVTAGNGLTKSGNTISVAFSTRIVNAAGLVDLQTLAIGGSGVGTFTKVTVDTFGRVTATATATPGDIGAQPATTALTNLSALAGTGLLVQTGGAANSGTFTERSIVAGGSATITITNGSGVAGNPTLELTSGVVAPGTYTSLTVDTFGRVTAGANPLVGQIAVSLTNNTGSTIGKLKALYKTTTADQIALAKADASTTQRFIGFAAAAINNGAAGTVITDGVAVGLTTDWDAVTGQTGGLTPGSVYYLSDVTAGTITTNPPSSDWRVPVGVAISTTQMLIAKLEPVQF